MLASLACGTKTSIEYVRHAAPHSAPPPLSPAARTQAPPMPGNAAMPHRTWDCGCMGKHGYAVTCVVLAALS